LQEPAGPRKPGLQHGGIIPAMRRVLVILLVTLACSRSPEGTGYSGTIEFPDVKVGSLVGGRVVEIVKREGEPAAADEVLVRLDPAEWQSALDEAQALAKATQRELELLIAGTRPEEIARAEAEARRQELLWSVVAEGSRPEEIAGAREDLRAAEALHKEAALALDRQETLKKQGASSAEALDKVRATQESAQARVAAAEQRLRLLERGARPAETEAAHQAYLVAKAQLDLLRAGARPEEIAARRATLEAAEARIRMAQSKLRELTIRAPADCFVQTLDLRPGDLLTPGQPVAVLILRDRPWLTLYVPEADLARIRVGQPAEIRPDGHAPLQGRVTWVSRESEYTPRNVQTAEERVTQVFAVKVVIEGDVSLLKDGIWADVTLR
jgi:HlyD family secretion protein